MAARGTPKDQGLNLPESTGAVEYEGPPQVGQQIVGDPGESTGAVEYDTSQQGKITNPVADEQKNGPRASKVEFPTPKEPTTMTSSWLSDAEAKVVTAQHKEDYQHSVAEPKKSAKAETPAKPDAEPKSAKPAETPAQDGTPAKTDDKADAAKADADAKSSGRRAKDDDAKHDEDESK